MDIKDWYAEGVQHGTFNKLAGIRRGCAKRSNAQFAQDSTSYNLYCAGYRSVFRDWKRIGFRHGAIHEAMGMWCPIYPAHKKFLGDLATHYQYLKGYQAGYDEAFAKRCQRWVVPAKAKARQVVQTCA